MFSELIADCMNRKFLALYLIAGTLALLLTVYQLVKTYPVFDNIGVIAINLLMCIFFFYLAYKTYHEKKDKELM
jgi:hypothetical protein